MILSPGFTLLNLANTGFFHLYLKAEPKLTALNIVLYANTMPCFAFFYSLSYQQHRITARNFSPFTLECYNNSPGAYKIRLVYKIG